MSLDYEAIYNMVELQEFQIISKPYQLVQLPRAVESLLQVKVS